MSRLRSVKFTLVLLGVALAAAAGFVVAFPAVEGLGNKVKLPVFHGAMTWVNLAVFSAMGLAALVCVFSRSERLYRWVESLRWVGVSMWLVGSVLGFLSAMQTWDFTGSRTSSRFEIVSADPRLMAQFWIVLAGLALIAAGMVVDDRQWLATFDVGFVLVMWLLLLRAILGPGRALHPDSPVLNSEELGIKALFLGIVIALGVASYAIASLVRSVRARDAERKQLAVETV